MLEVIYVRPPKEGEHSQAQVVHLLVSFHFPTVAYELQALQVRFVLGYALGIGTEGQSPPVQSNGGNRELFNWLLHWFSFFFYI